MYSPPYELQQKESELMCLLKQLLVVEDLSQQPSYTVPSCPFLHHRLSCLKPGEGQGGCSICHVNLRSLMNVKLDHILVSVQSSSPHQNE